MCVRHSRRPRNRGTGVPPVVRGHRTPRTIWITEIVRIEATPHGRDANPRMLSRDVAAPEGRLGNSPALQCGGLASMFASPGGTAEISDVSTVPPGLFPFFTSGPGTEVPGYYHSVPAGRFLAFPHWWDARVTVKASCPR